MKDKNTPPPHTHTHICGPLNFSDRTLACQAQACGSPSVRSGGREPNAAASPAGPAEPCLPRAVRVQPSPKHVSPTALHPGRNEITHVCSQGRGAGMVLIYLHSATQNAAGQWLSDMGGIPRGLCLASVLRGQQENLGELGPACLESLAGEGAPNMGPPRGNPLPQPRRREIRLWFLGPSSCPPNSGSQAYSANSQWHCSEEPFRKRGRTWSRTYAACPGQRGSAGWSALPHSKRLRFDLQSGCVGDMTDVSLSLFLPPFPCL